MAQNAVLDEGVPLFPEKTKEKGKRKSMGVIEIVLMGVGLAMDAFAVAVCKGLAMRKDNPLAKNKFITREDLAQVPILCSRQLIKTHDALNPYIQWLGQDWNSINVVATYNLIFNAALMVEAGLGCAVAIDKLINTTSVSNLCFRPFKPKLESALNVVWKKDQVFSSCMRAMRKAVIPMTAAMVRTPNTRRRR